MTSEHILKYTDLSTMNNFRFLFHCDRCGAGVYSERYIFNTEEFHQPLDEKARSLLWLRQHKEAYERAAGEARFEFNVCPACGQWVCDSCFCTAPERAADICLDCKNKPEKPTKWKWRLSRRPLLE